jgi:hypothetical protein
VTRPSFALDVAQNLFAVIVSQRSSVIRVS